ncbi:RING finger protein 213 [Myotis brandtii]|uniref:RING finger protein 213 n=1 Tax=Myotis brandtii TaxID=109478 RepID=S7P372_MYOBR|nr:RING finger protein 213 [Myotis brandtii]
MCDIELHSHEVQGRRSGTGRAHSTGRTQAPFACTQAPSLCTRIRGLSPSPVPLVVSQAPLGQWTRIFSVALFVEHVLLGTEDHSPELHTLLTDYVFSLDKCLQGNSDIKTLRPFSAVMATLRECKDRASKTFTRVAIEQHARFRHLCTSFFVDLVSTLCFKDNCPPSRDVVQELLSLLFVEKTLLRDAPQRHCEHTKSLSPFDDMVDKTPVIRSVVLKLLLKYSFPEVKDCIQDHLSQLEQKPFLAEDKTELYVLFSSCLEDSIHEKNSALPAQGDSTYLQEDGQFLGECLPRCSRDPGLEASIEYLQETARIRLCLDRACEVLSKLLEGSGKSPLSFLSLAQKSLDLAEEQRQFLRQVERFCTQSGNDWYRVYLVRRLVSRQGMEFVQSFLQPDHPAQWVFPQEVQAQQACRGSQTHQATYLLLALFREVTTLYRSQNTHLHPKPQELKALGKFIKESQTLSPDMRDFATGLVTNDLPLLRTAGPGDGGLAGMVTELAVHTAATLLCGQHRVLEPLRNLAFSPATMARAFLPTMPQDMLAQARSWKGLERVQWYSTCPVPWSQSSEL